MSFHALRLRVGPDPHGEWIVDDESGVCGAICASRDEALRFAKAECEAVQSAEWRLVPQLDLAALFAPHQTCSTCTTPATDFNAPASAPVTA
jgi:hypothetical protein